MFHSFILSLCSNTLTLESVFEYIRQKLIKNMLILKFHPGMKCLHVFFFFFSSRDEISSWQKRVNSKRHFTIYRNDFIPERVSSGDEISRVNTLLHEMAHGKKYYLSRKLCHTTRNMPSL